MAGPPAAAKQFNKVAVRVAGRRFVPLWAVLRHRGRKSGKEYATPVAVIPTDTTFVIALPWGRETDWVRNVRAAGRCTVSWKGVDYECTEPTFVDKGVALAAARGVTRRALQRRDFPDGFIQLTRRAGATYRLEPVGWVRSSLRDTADAPRQADEGAPQATLEFVPAVREALDGLSPGDRVHVLTWLHHADRETLKVHPRGDVARPLTGVFATRASDRPNPIGLHDVVVVALAGLTMTVDHLEAVDGTPVLDVKPVLGLTR